MSSPAMAPGTGLTGSGEGYNRGCGNSERHDVPQQEPHNSRVRLPNASCSARIFRGTVHDEDREAKTRDGKKQVGCQMIEQVKQCCLWQIGETCRGETSSPKG